MPNEKGGFYEQEGVPQEEIERLKTFEFPTYVSETLLRQEDLAGKRFLDSGAGANPSLGKFIEKQNGIYVPLDLRTEMLKPLKESITAEGMSFSGVNADVRKLPFDDESIDLAHQRFVLMHLSPDDRRQAIQEILRVTKEKAFLLEYDWGTIKSSKYEGQLGEFLTASRDLSKKLGIEQLMGARLEEFLHDLDPKLNVQVTPFNREEGDYTRDLVGLAGMSAKMAALRLNDKALGDKFLEIEEQLKKEPIEFVPASVVAATIEK